VEKQKEMELKINFIRHKVQQSYRNNCRLSTARQM
jgi:hypothetical protein